MNSEQYETMFFELDVFISKYSLNTVLNAISEICQCNSKMSKNGKQWTEAGRKINNCRENIIIE